MRHWMRTLLLAVCMLAMASAQAQGPVCISTEETAALLTADGRELAAPGRFDDVYCVIPGERYALGERTDGGMRYALCDSQGRILTEPLYALFQAADGIILFKQNNLYGAMDADGNVLLPAAYTQLIPASDGQYLAMRTDPFDDDADEILLISAEGGETPVDVRTDEGLERLSSDRMPFQNSATEKFGYIDGNGKIVIEAKFDTAGGFENGLARASENGKLGLIGPDGQWKVEPQFDFLETGGKASVGLIGRETFVVLDENGDELFHVAGSGLEAALAGSSPILLTEERMLVYSLSGEVVLETQRQATVTPGADGMLILADGDWGESCVSLVSPEGERSERTDQYLMPLDSDRYAFIRMNAASYYSESLDEIRVSCDYDSLRCGMMNAAGEEILPAEYLEIRALGYGRYLTVAEDGLRMTDGDGNVLWAYLKE